LIAGAGKYRLIPLGTVISAVNRQYQTASRRQLKAREAWLFLVKSLPVLARENAAQARRAANEVRLR